MTIYKDWWVKLDEDYLFFVQSGDIMYVEDEYTHESAELVNYYLHMCT